MEKVRSITHEIETLLTELGLRGDYSEIPRRVFDGLSSSIRTLDEVDTLTNGMKRIRVEVSQLSQQLI